MTREEAIKELSYIADEMPSMECANWIEAISMAIKALEQEPCEMKPRKIGHWIDVDDEDEWFGSVYKCSVCGHETLDHEGFCSKCGSRMQEVNA